MGPLSLNAIDFITLGTPSSSDFGDVKVESFTLENGWLHEQSGQMVYFPKIKSFDETGHNVAQSNALKAGECGGDCGGFCVDQDGYLVSIGLSSISLSVFKTDRVTDDGDYVHYRVKFYACPNGEQDVFGGGEYKVFLNSIHDENECVPIYLGVKELFGYSLRDVVNVQKLSRPNLNIHMRDLCLILRPNMAAQFLKCHL